MTLTSTKNIIPPAFSNIPVELQQLPQWVLWRAEMVKESLTKIPYQPNGSKASVKSSRTWKTFKTIKKAYENGHFDGIGFVFTKDDPYIGIDLDDENIDNLSGPGRTLSLLSYTELSPSGNGLHVIMKGKMPEGANNRKGPIEIYEKERYLTFTGNVITDKPITGNDEAIRKIVEKYVGFKSKRTVYLVDASKSVLDDETVLQNMFNSKNGEKIKLLFQGNHVYTSQSEADLALCNHLAYWTNGNAEQMDRLFRQSSLYREKWEREDYREQLLTKAISDTKMYADGVAKNNKIQGLDINHKTGRVLATSKNLETILSNPPFKDILCFDVFKNRECIRGDLPWRKREYPNKPYEQWQPSDDKRLCHWIGKEYEINAQTLIINAFVEITRKNTFHPIKEYLEAQTWDGSARVETFFIDYLGAEDTPYIRAVTKKWLVAAVKRIYEPGCKFDYMPVLVGPQGVGKSSTIATLARDWFSDSLKSFDNKEAGEHLQNSWIFEFGELAAMRKGAVEEIKAFITKQTDSYRMAYDRVVSEFPRKCVFIGTTNTQDFLRDQTGNRRFWPITVDPDKRKYTTSTDLTSHLVGQIWAEAMELYHRGEKLYLDEELESTARKVQEGHMEHDPKTGIIKEYLETLLPHNWDNMHIWERQNYLKKPTGNVNREKVCAVEIWTECLENDHKKMTVWESRQICDILRKLGWIERKPARTRFKHYGSQTTFVKG